MPIDDTGWRKPIVTQTPGETPKGVIQMKTGLENKPCFMCKSWEKDTRKLIQHFKAKGLTPDAEGYYTTPIVQDFDNRKSLRINPREYGYCRRLCMPTGDTCTCPDWQLTQTRSELALKVK
jgi:hypothetical protein